MRASLLSAVTVASFLVLAGCAAETNSPSADPAAAPGGDATSEDDLAGANAKVIATKRAYPSDLFLSGNKVYWSESRQVASGDPELDQEFAYWTGTVWSFDLSHSTSPKKLADLASNTLGSVQTDGNDLWFTEVGGVSKTNVASLEPKKDWSWIYSDISHFPDASDDEGVASSVVQNGRIYVLRNHGQVVSVKTDGSDYKVHAESTAWASDLFVGNGTGMWVSASPTDDTMKAIYTVKLGSTKTKPDTILTLKDDPSNFVQDGTTVYFGVQATYGKAGSGSIMKATIGSKTAPTPVVSGLDRVNKIVLDGDNLLFTGKKGTVEGLFTVAKADLGPGATAKTMYRLKAASGVLTTSDAIFVTSGALDRSNRYDGSVVRIAKK